MRTEQPYNNPYYIRKASGGYNGAVKGKPTIKGADVLCNCVGYANGRFAEIQDPGYIKHQLVCNAENFIERAKSFGLEISAVPVLGGIMVWQRGATLSDSDGAGHVAVVEKVISADQIITSESGWNAWAFKNVTRSNANGRWGQSEAYKFRGCIVNPAIGRKGAEEIKSIEVDGLWGVMTTLFSQQRMKTFEDGFVSGQLTTCKKYLPNALTSSWEFSKNGKGSELIKAIQKLVGATQDGYAGYNTILALQRFLKAQGYYDGGALDGIMGSVTVKGWQKWLNNPKYNPVKETIAQKAIDACLTQAEWMKNYQYEWESYPTIPKSKYRGTCVTYVACVLQRIGILSSGQYIWHDESGKVTHANSRMQVIYPKNQTLASYKSNIRAGDIIMVGDKHDVGGGSHILIVNGVWQDSNPVVWDNHSCERRKKGYHGNYAYTGKRSIIAIVRLKEAEDV